MTKVIFKILEGEIIALFPELAGDNNPYRTCLSYMHVGQHFAASVELSKLKSATPEKYMPLFYELVGQGYNDLKVVKRFSRNDLQKRIAQTDIKEN